MSLASWSDGGSFSASETMSFVSDDQPHLVHYTPFGRNGLTSVGKIIGVQQQQKEGRQDVLYLWALPASSKGRSSEVCMSVCIYIRLGGVHLPD